jgi:hypothetical protein
MIERGHGLRFPVEALAALRIGRGARRQELEGYQPVQAGIAGGIDLL